MNKWIVVTGASSGIGKELSTMLLEQGYSVVLTARNRDTLEKVGCEESVSKTSNFQLIPWDLSELDSLKEYASIVHDKVGPINGFVHCAGIQKTIPMSLTKKKILNEVFTINTFSAMQLISFFSRKGFFQEFNTSFILISSLATHEGSIGQSIYAASKGSLEGYLSSAAAELIKKGIRLNIVIPGIVKTKMVENYILHLNHAQLSSIQNGYPLGFGNPIDIAYMIEYLLSKKSRWITGQSFVIDGGHLSRSN